MSGPTRLPALSYDGLSPQLSMGRPKDYWVGFEGVARAVAADSTLETAGKTLRYKRRGAALRYRLA